MSTTSPAVSSLFFSHVCHDCKKTTSLPDTWLQIPPLFSSRIHVPAYLCDATIWGKKCRFADLFWDSGTRIRASAKRIQLLAGGLICDQTWSRRADYHTWSVTYFRAGLASSTSKGEGKASDRDVKSGVFVLRVLFFRITRIFPKNFPIEVHISLIPNHVIHIKTSQHSLNVHTCSRHWQR